MRLIVMFDLPSVKKVEMREYRKWRSLLLKNGFIMMTESVYSRLVINKSVSASVKKLLKENTPKDGMVQLLEVTERQFASIDYLIGEEQQIVINSSERYIEI